MSRRMYVYAALLMLCCPTLSLAQSVAAPAPQPLTIDGAVTHVYKSIGGTDLRLHIFNPPIDSASRARPAVVFFFGGAWTGGTVGQFVPQSKHFAQRGIVTIVADYRVFGRHQTSAFDAMADAKSAIRWVRSHAAELRIDPNRIAAGGGSAGGYLALAAAAIESYDEAGEDARISSKPNALVLFNPAVNTAPDGGTAGGSGSEALKSRFGGRGRDGSPFHHLRSGLPPTIILHGKADTTVPYSDVDRYCAEAVKQGNQCQLVGYDGAAHGFFNPQNAEGKWYRETLLEADRFLTRLGYLQGPSPTQIH